MGRVLKELMTGTPFVVFVLDKKNLIMILLRRVSAKITKNMFMKNDLNQRFYSITQIGTGGAENDACTNST